MVCSKCGSDYAENYFRSKYLPSEIICQDCLLEIDCMTTNTITQYFLDGNYMGSDEDINEVTDSICRYTEWEEIEEDNI